MSPFILSTLHHFSYLGVFVILVGAAIVIPIPEEITLLTVGYLIAIGFLNPSFAVLAACAGLFVGDVVLFSLAKYGSSYTKRLRARADKVGLDKTWLFSPTQPLRSVFLLRFFTGFRFIAPLYAGFAGASWTGYTAVDLASIAIVAPILILLGYLFNAHIVAFIAGFEVVRHAIFIGILALAGWGSYPRLYAGSPKSQKRVRNYLFTAYIVLHELFRFREYTAI